MDDAKAEVVQSVTSWYLVSVCLSVCEQDYARKHSIDFHETLYMYDLDCCW